MSNSPSDLMDIKQERMLWSSAGFQRMINLELKFFETQLIPNTV